VIVEGTPTDPEGEPLCEEATEAAPAEGVAAAQALSTCDATDDDEATVRVVTPGTIIINKTTDPASSDSFDFTLGDQEFSLSDGGSKTFAGLAPGSHELSEEVPSGWQVGDLSCDDATGDTEVDPANGTAAIDLAEGETVTCNYTNVEDSDEPDEPSGTDSLSDTGAPPWLGVALALGVLLVAGGIGLVVTARRRSRLTRP
jgi:hypothetical protein